MTTDNYVVVARRYRPQSFDALVGQQHVAQALAGAITSDRVGHAYLFTGARGVGKTSAARILAKALNCVEGMSPHPCGICEICAGVSAGDDVDVLEIDGASNRGIDEIRQLRQNAAVRPSRARYKIYIIDEVHMLTKEAFNALLKTLEEPPDHVKFIFATTEPNKIPITILSRCQRYDFAGIASPSIQRRLAEIAAAEGVAADPEALQILAIRAAGSMRDSQSLLEQLLATGSQHVTAADVTSLLGLAPSARLSGLVQSLIQRDAAAALAQLDEAVGEGTEVGQLIDQLLGYFRDAITQAVGCDESRLLYALPGQVEEVREVAAALGVETLLAIAQILDQTAARLRVSTQVRTLAEMALVRIAKLGDLDSLAELVAQLSTGEAAPSAASSAASSVETAAPRVALKKNVRRDPPQVVNAGSAASDAQNRSTSDADSRTSDADRGSSDADRGSTQDTPIRARVPGGGGPSTSAVGPSTSAGDAVATGSRVATASPGVQVRGEVTRATWTEAVGRLSGMVADHAAAATQVEVDARGTLVVSFPESLKFSRDACGRPANLARISQCLQEVHGGPVTLELRTHSDPEGAGGVSNPAKTRRERQQEIAARPFVRNALELFDADATRMRYVPPGSSKGGS